jgi:mRNA-degrading endonuclease RelE of RelBE toxin-antitoxin system
VNDWEIIEEVHTQMDLYMRRVSLDDAVASGPSSMTAKSLKPEFDESEYLRCESIELPRHDVWAREATRTGPPPWSIGFSKQFKKDTSAMDRKLLGRILEVLEEISDYELPFKAVGDTFKPLTGHLEGSWRYRIGDSRLVVRPVVESAQIHALMFGSRGSVYE